MIRDVRALHQGTPNNTAAPRPMVVIGYSRSWYSSTARVSIGPVTGGQAIAVIYAVRRESSGTERHRESYQIRILTDSPFGDRENLCLRRGRGFDSIR